MSVGGVRIRKAAVVALVVAALLSTKSVLRADSGVAKKVGQKAVELVNDFKAAVRREDAPPPKPVKLELPNDPLRAQVRRTPNEGAFGLRLKKEQTAEATINRASALPTIPPPPPVAAIGISAKTATPKTSGLFAGLQQLRALDIRTVRGKAFETLGAAKRKIEQGISTQFTKARERLARVKRGTQERWAKLNVWNKRRQNAQRELQRENVAAAAIESWQNPSISPRSTAVVPFLDTLVPLDKQRQMSRRGWTKSSIDEIVNRPAMTRPSVAINKRRNVIVRDPATAYIRLDGHYVVRNDVSGELVQMSNTKKPIGRTLGNGAWVPASDIEGFPFPKDN